MIEISKVHRKEFMTSDKTFRKIWLQAAFLQFKQIPWIDFSEQSNVSRSDYHPMEIFYIAA